MTDSVAAPPDALSQRLEALAAQAASEARTEQQLLILVAELRREVIALRGDVGRIGGSLDEQTQPLEARLAAIEDSLDGVAERVEAFARDGASTTGERLSALARDVAQLSSAFAARTDELRDHIADRTADSAATLLDAAVTADEQVVGRIGESIGALASGVRDAIDAFAGSVERSLTALGGSVGAALGEARDAHDDHLDEVSTSLADAVRALSEALTGQFETQLAALRTELVGKIADSAAQTKSLLTENERTAAARVAEIKRGVDVHAAELDSATKHVSLLAKASNETKTVLGRMETSWQQVAGQVVAEAHAAAAAELDEFRGRVGREMEAVRAALRETVDSVAASRAQLADGTDRLGAAGRALLEYLAVRDEELEQARDRILHELLDDFAQGLKPRDRRGLAQLLQTSRERTADRRDAERWRKQKTGEAAPPPVPLVIAPEPAAPEANDMPVGLEFITTTSVPPPLKPAAEPAVELAAEGPITAPAAPAKAPRPVKAAKPAAKPAKPAKAAVVKPAKPAKRVAKATGPLVAPPRPDEAPPPPAEVVEGAPPETAAASAAEVAATPEPVRPARRRRASVDAMPEVGSHAAALEAAVPQETPPAGAPEAPTPTAAPTPEEAASAAVDAFAEAVKPKRGLRRH